MTNEQLVANELLEGAFARNEEDYRKLDLDQSVISQFLDDSVAPEFRIQYEGKWYTVTVKED